MRRAWIQGLFLWLCFSPTFAALNLELTQGLYGSLPVIFSVGGDKTEADAQIADIISQQVRRDLSLSGEFSVTEGNAVIPTMERLATIQKKGQVYVGFLQLANEADDQYSASLIFFDLMSDKNIDFTRPKGITRYTFPVADVERFSHVVADDFYHYMTGAPGLFSTQLAYVVHKKRPGMSSIYRLEVANYDGKHAQTIVESYEPIMSPTWSHDGKWLAYVSFEGKKSAVYIQELSTGIRKRVSDINGVNAAPSWSLDDSQLAIVLSDGGYTKIHLYTLADNQMEPLTSGYSIDTEPTWSAVDNRLFFTSNRGGKPQIYSHNFSDNTVERVTFKGVYNASPTVSPDGKYIVYLHKESGLFSLAAQNLEKGTINIISHEGYEESPDMAPNGRLVVFASKYGARGVLEFVSLDGALHWRLPAIHGSVQEPAWSPLLPYRTAYLVDETHI
jgi:TolB protein